MSEDVILNVRPLCFDVQAISYAIMTHPHFLSDVGVVQRRIEYSEE